MSLQGAEALSIGKAHESLFERRIYTKSMIKQGNKCGVQLGLRYGLITGKPEKEPPGYVMQLGLTLDDLLTFWTSCIIAGLKPPTSEEARQYLSDKWDSRMGTLEEPPPDAKDAKVAKLLLLYEAWLELWETQKGFLGPILGAQLSFGYDGTKELGGIKIAGHMDLLTERAVWDWKCGGQRSWYRKSKVEPYPYELAHYAALTGKMNTAYATFVHDLKTKAPVELAERVQDEYSLDLAAQTLQRFDAVIQTGNPLMLQGPEKIGAGLCQAKYCGFFGKQCPLTKNIKRTP